MKPHRTVTITRRYLEWTGACPVGIARASHLLPAKISTDPEANIRLACELVYIGDRGNPNRTLSQGGIGSVFYGAGYRVYNDLSSACVDCGEGIDVGFIAQGLAILADELLSARGR